MFSDFHNLARPSFDVNVEPSAPERFYKCSSHWPVISALVSTVGGPTGAAAAKRITAATRWPKSL
jgi:hypothetical protein